MSYFNFIWTDDIVEHLEEHDISIGDYEHIVCNPSAKGISRSSGLPAVWGYTHDNRYIIAVFEKIDAVTILPVTAYEVTEPH